MSSTLKQSLCLFLKKPGNQLNSTTRQAFLKQMHMTSHLGSRIQSSSSQKAQAKLKPSAEEGIYCFLDIFFSRHLKFTLFSLALSVNFFSACVSQAAHAGGNDFCNANVPLLSLPQLKARAWPYSRLKGCSAPHQIKKYKYSHVFLSFSII